MKSRKKLQGYLIMDSYGDYVFGTRKVLDDGNNRSLMEFGFMNKLAKD